MRKRIGGIAGQMGRGSLRILLLQDVQCPWTRPKPPVVVPKLGFHAAEPATKCGGSATRRLVRYKHKHPAAAIIIPVVFLIKRLVVLLFLEFISIAGAIPAGFRRVQR